MSSIPDVYPAVTKEILESRIHNARWWFSNPHMAGGNKSGTNKKRWKKNKKGRKKTKKKGNIVKNKQIIIGGTIEKMTDYVELFDVYKDTLSYGLLQDKLYINLSVLTSKFINSLDNPSSLYTGYFDNEIYNIKSNITDIRSLINSESSVMMGRRTWF